MTPRRRRYWLAGFVAAAALAGCVRTEALLIRDVFEWDAEKTKKELEAYAPKGVATIADQQYLSGDPNAQLDAYFPETAAQSGARLPIVVWTHGGAWISGHKDDAAPYLQLIAAQGYTVFSVDYSLGPEHEYPAPVHQVNAALSYITSNAARFHADPERIVLAGDSAGAQITSQIAALITNPTFAAQLDVKPALQPGQLRGVVLYCGIYDMKAFLDSTHVKSTLLYWGTETAISAYTGSHNPNSPALQQMSTINHVTPAFPATFISGGNADPLTDYQSVPLATKLKSLNTNVTTLFYSSDHQPPLMHEYQFRLDMADGQKALQEMLTFIKQRTE